MKVVSRIVVVSAIFSLSLLYFGCGGAELSSAKLYRQQRNYVKANELLEQALKSDPTSDEAWALYVTNLYDLNKYEKIGDVIDTARLYAVKNRAQIEFIRRNTWVQLYNGGVSAYEQNPDSKEQQQAAISLLETARRVSPDQVETYEILGNVYYSANDTAKAIAIYQEALSQVRPMHDQGVALGLALKQEPTDAENAIGGAPAKKEMTLVGGDSVMIYVYPSKEGYLYFEKAKKTRKWQLTGWKFTNSEAVGMNPSRISLNTYKSVAQYYMNKGDNAYAAGNKAQAEQEYEKVVPLFIAVQRLDPSDLTAASIIPDIYKKMGQTDKAKAEYERMLSEHPSKNLYSSYGVVLMNSGDNPGAIAAFEKALEIDPSFQNALFNLGATYQNEAVAMQKKDKKKVIPILEKAVEYFEKSYTVSRNDYLSISYLIEDYDILGNKEKSKKFLAELDNLRTTDAVKDYQYWNSLGKAFAKTDPTKSAEAFKKVDELMRK